ncbi:MAG: hypothetical protein HAW59_01355, partial [Betaproteobacteria bacterium]|nr:hypothetical protein [Betaproteobacteria bacterium]
ADAGINGGVLAINSNGAVMLQSAFTAAGHYNLNVRATESGGGGIVRENEIAVEVRQAAARLEILAHPQTMAVRADEINAGRIIGRVASAGGGAIVQYSLADAPEFVAVNGRGEIYLTRQIFAPRAARRFRIVAETADGVTAETMAYFAVAEAAADSWRMDGGSAVLDVGFYRKEFTSLMTLQICYTVFNNPRREYCLGGELPDSVDAKTIVTNAYITDSQPFSGATLTLTAGDYLPRGLSGRLSVANGAFAMSGRAGDKFAEISGRGRNMWVDVQGVAVGAASVFLHPGSPFRVEATMRVRSRGIGYEVHRYLRAGERRAWDQVPAFNPPIEFGAEIFRHVDQRKNIYNIHVGRSRILGNQIRVINPVGQLSGVDATDNDAQCSVSDSNYQRTDHSIFEINLRCNDSARIRTQIGVVKITPNQLFLSPPRPGGYDLNYALINVEGVDGGYIGHPINGSGELLTMFAQVDNLAVCSPCVLPGTTPRVLPASARITAPVSVAFANNNFPDGVGGEFVLTIELRPQPPQTHAATLTALLTVRGVPDVEFVPPSAAVEAGASGIVATVRIPGVHERASATVSIRYYFGGPEPNFALSTYFNNATVLVLTNTALVNRVVLATVFAEFLHGRFESSVPAGNPIYAGLRTDQSAVFTLTVRAANSADVRLSPSSARLTAFPTPATDGGGNAIMVHKADKTILATASFSSNAAYQFGLINLHTVGIPFSPEGITEYEITSGLDTRCDGGSDQVCARNVIYAGAGNPRGLFFAAIRVGGESGVISFENSGRLNLGGEEGPRKESAVVMPGTYTLTVAAFLQDGEVADMEELRVEVVEPVAASPIVV